MSQTIVDELTCYQILYWLSKTFHPSSYLEVGVREGASLCCVLASEPEIVEFTRNCLQDGLLHLTPDIITRINDSFTPYNPDTELYLFDNWSFHGGEDGHHRIEDLLVNGFHHTRYHIVDGDSQTTLPDQLRSVKGQIDLAFIDGDHTEEGAWTDLMNMRHRFKIMVFHDLYHPQHGYLASLFQRYVDQHSYTAIIAGRKHFGTGVIFNIR